MNTKLSVAIAVMIVSDCFAPIDIPEDEGLMYSFVQEMETAEEETEVIVYAEEYDDRTPGVIIAEPEEDVIIPFKEESYEYNPTQPHLTKQGGVFQGPSGKETYYNLNMSGVVQIMRDLGYSEEDYPYYIRESDGVKMLGPYVMIAADFGIRPRGTVLSTSLGMGLVCDTGGFATGNSTLLDIAVSW